MFQQEVNATTFLFTKLCVIHHFKKKKLYKYTYQLCDKILSVTFFKSHSTSFELTFSTGEKIHQNKQRVGAC